MHMRHCLALIVAALALLNPLSAASGPQHPASYLGFDRNDYPGDAALAALRKTFAFTGYWLSNPPGESANSWRGKREVVERAGFGFLLLFNGHDYAELKASARGPRKLGVLDGTAAGAAARAEGFPAGSVIFLDQEQGGRMLPEQKQYIFAWAEEVRRAGFRPGIYCSGIPVREGAGWITTAQDLHDTPQGSGFVFWVANDACPPSPGCAFAMPPPQVSGVPFAEIWQFAQSPMRPQFAAGCRRSYSSDGNCYPPGRSQGLYLDVNSATSPDPSHARR
jgi:glycoside hydrolase-like protein